MHSLVIVCSLSHSNSLLNGHLRYLNQALFWECIYSNPLTESLHRPFTKQWLQFMYLKMILTNYSSVSWCKNITVSILRKSSAREARGIVSVLCRNQADSTYDIWLYDYDSDILYKLYICTIYNISQVVA